MTSKKTKEKQKDAKSKQAEKGSVILHGLVLDWTLPSKATLQDWLKQDNPDVRVREIVELFPQEIFTELETLRRGFYRKMESLIVHAYSLKLLPFDALPKAKDVIEETRKCLKELDDKVLEALESDYYRKATQYYKTTSGFNPKSACDLSKRFEVMMLPLKLDPWTWSEFLTNEMKEQRKRMEERLDRDYQRNRSRLDHQLAKIQEAITKTQAELASKQKDIQEADQVLEEIYEPVKLPVDVATLRVEKKELEDKVKELHYQEKELQRKVNKLDLERRNQDQQVTRSFQWARRETENTERIMTFDVNRLWADNLKQYAKECLDALESLNDKLAKRILRKIKKAAEETQERIWSVQPTNRILNTYEQFIKAITLTKDWSKEECINVLKGVI